MRVCSTALCVVLGGLATATSASAQGAAFGVKGGVNFSSLTFAAGKPDVNFDQRTGFVGGLFVVVPATSTVALQTEFLYSQKGSEFDVGGGTAKIKLDYVEIPIMLRLSSKPAQASFHAFTGPSLGFRTRARGTGEFEGESADEDIDNNVESFDFGYVVGAGVDLGRMTVDGRYTWGLSDIDKDKSDDVEIKNRTFSIMLGVRF